MIQNNIAVFQFKPFSQKQKKVLTWWLSNSPVNQCNGIIADGAIRSGKTVSMSLSFVIWAMQCFEYKNFAMCGKTIGSFRRNVLFVLKNMLQTIGYILEEHRTENMIEIKRNGITNYFYIFGGKDERSQDLIQGITLAGVFFDEVALMPETFVNQATGRCSERGSKFWFNCNPEGPYHWFKVNWIDKKDNSEKGKNLYYLHFTMNDNISLSEEIKKRYQNMYAGVFYLRYVLGKWVLADGVIYDMFSEERNTYQNIPDNIKSSARRYISCDYGTSNPMVFLDIWDDGDVIWIDNEYYYDSREKKVQKSDNRYGDDFDEFVALENKVPSWVIIDPSAANFATELKNRRYRVKQGDNSVLEGIRLVATMLDKAKIKVNVKCVNWLKEIRGYVWDTKAQEHGKEKPVEIGDHAMDATRYFVKTIIPNRRFAK